MKKRLLALFCAITMILACFTGCGAPKNANALYKKIHKAMGKLDSVESNVTIDIGFYSNGTFIDAEATGRTIVQSEKKDYYYYSNLTTSVGIPGSKLVSKATSLIAYNDGNMFISNSGDGINQKFYSTLDKKEAIEYINEHSLTLSTFTDASKKEFSRIDDTYSLVFSEYSDDALDTVIQYFGFDSFNFDNKVEDMNVTINTKPDYLIDDIAIEFVFSAQPKYTRKSTIKVNIDYVKYEDVEKETNGLSTNAFEKIDDIRILEKIEDMIKERQDSKSGKFNLELKQTVTAKGEKSEYTEKDVVSYGVGDDGYFYDIDALIQKDKYIISYSDGTKTTKVGTKTTTDSQSADDAKEFIDGLIDVAKYSFIYVTKIQNDGNGLYTITCQTPNPELYTAVLASVGASYSSGSQTLEISIKDDKIMSINSTMTAKGRVQSVSVTFNIESKLTFED